MWSVNKADRAENQKYYRQCGKYTICKYGDRYALTHRPDANTIFIHGWFDSFKLAVEYYDVNLSKNGT